MAMVDNLLLEFYSSRENHCPGRVARVLKDEPELCNCACHSQVPTGQAEVMPRLSRDKRTTPPRLQSRGVGRWRSTRLPSCLFAIAPLASPDADELHLIIGHCQVDDFSTKWRVGSYRICS